MVVNLPPLGCMPALLTLHPADPSLANSYDDYGCLKRFNKPIKAHNSLLRSSLNTLRTTYPDANLYYGDLHGVFINILKNSSDHGKVLSILGKMLTLYPDHIQMNLTLDYCYTKNAGIFTDVLSHGIFCVRHIKPLASMLWIRWFV